MKRQMIMLSNLNCPNCAAKLEKAAKQLPGMKSATVAFGSGALNVEFDETRMEEPRLKELVRQMGLGIATVVNRPA
jgi:copper chaperone CopZ